MQQKVYNQSDLGKSQHSILSMLSPGSKVLEIGCAMGYMTRYLAQDLGCNVTVLEINPEQANVAAQHAGKCVVGDVTDDDTLFSAGSEFDNIIFADVLEHIADPWDVLRKCKRMLKNNGAVLASIPNIAYYKIRKQLLFGHFNYQSYGILDDSHLRFFTASTVQQLFTKSGYTVSQFKRIYEHKTDRRLSWLCPNAFTYQFVIKAVASGE